jgi:hypothetical protein
MSVLRVEEDAGIGDRAEGPRSIVWCEPCVEQVEEGISKEGKDQNSIRLVAVRARKEDILRVE